MGRAAPQSRDAGALQARRRAPPHRRDPAGDHGNGGASHVIAVPITWDARGSGYGCPGPAKNLSQLVGARMPAFGPPPAVIPLSDCFSTFAVQFSMATAGVCGFSGLN